MARLCQFGSDGILLLLPFGNLLLSRRSILFLLAQKFLLLPKELGIPSGQLHFPELQHRFEMPTFTEQREALADGGDCLGIRQLTQCRHDRRQVGPDREHAEPVRVQKFKSAMPLAHFAP